jgi:hypothetical protein
MSTFDRAGFTPRQLEAALDLLVLGMYSDRHLAVAEDAELNELLGRLGCRTEYDRGQKLDAAITRVRAQLTGRAQVLAYVDSAAATFTSGEQRAQVARWLDRLIDSDRQVTEEERSFLTVVREALRA